MLEICDWQICSWQVIVVQSLHNPAHVNSSAAVPNKSTIFWLVNHFHETDSPEWHLYWVMKHLKILGGNCYNRLRNWHNLVHNCLLEVCSSPGYQDVKSSPIHNSRGAQTENAWLWETTTLLKMAVFWVVAPCSLVEVYWCFRGACCLYY
jgi:hypothetical protein